MVPSAQKDHSMYGFTTPSTGVTFEQAVARTIAALHAKERGVTGGNVGQSQLAPDPSPGAYQPESVPPTQQDAPPVPVVRPV
jgi:hypothetical protein